MAIDKLVDSSQLDNNLTLVANAIRTKGGTSASLSFPTDFVTAINAISGGGTRTTIVPEQTANYSERYNQINFVAPLVVGEIYSYTIDGVESQSMAFDNYGSVAIGSPETTIGFEYANGMMYLSIADSSLRTTHTVKVEQESSGGGGGSATLITKTITANGTYSAEDDNADGYSSVTVNVPSGASNVVTGTFKGTTTGAAMDVDLNYSGSGYPIVVMIFPSDADASTFQSTIQRYAVRSYMMDKYDKTSAPVYAGSTAADYAAPVLKYKSSTTNSRSLSNGGATNATTLLYADESATADISRLVKIRSNKKLSVFIASTSYGFMANIEYSYVVLYSS